MDGIEPNWATVEGRIEGVNKAAKAAGKRAVRKDAVVMADVVVTLPENVRMGDEFKFFGYTYWFLIQKLGKENMMGGFVHRDEVRKDGSPVRDHMHVPFTPILDGRFNYKKMCPRSFYQTMHGELGTIWKTHGLSTRGRAGDETRAMRVYADKSADIDKVRGAVDRAVVQPAEEEAARIVADAQARADALVRDAETRRTSWWLRSPMASAGSDVRMQVDEETDRLSAFGKERTGLRETLRNWNPSLPMFAGSRVRDALNAAQSSIQSLLDAQERREQLERQLRSLRPNLGADASWEGAAHRAQLG